MTDRKTEGNGWLDIFAGEPVTTGSDTVSTAAAQAGPPGNAAPAVVSVMRRLEAARTLDWPARALAAVADGVVRSPGVDDALRGAWLGHALHPLLTDFPLGAWMSASFLDLFGGREARRPAQRLVGFGLVAAAPTIAAGLAEWRPTTGGSRRVGVLHAAVNSTATGLYAASWLARRRGSHRLAVGLGVGGGVVATLGGYVGGHLSLVRKIGTADPRFGPG